MSQQRIAVVLVSTLTLMLASLPFSVPARASEEKPTPPTVSFSRPYHDGAVVVLWETNYTQAQLDAIIARAIQAGVRTLEVPVFGCQSNITSSDVGACELGSRAQELLLVQRAAAAGLNVSVLPIVATPTWDWRGLFNPTDVAGWFQSYEAWLTQLAKDVRAAGASELIAGSEFKILYQYGTQWSQLLRDLRSVFTGPLIVTANWDNFNYTFWGDSDAIGVSSYFPLTTSSSGSPSQDDLDAAWKKIKSQLLAVGKKWDRPLYFTEVGYNSTTSAALTPWGSQPGDTEDLSLQAECFAAMQSAWATEKNLVRANVWAIGDPSLEGNGQPTFDFIGTPSESVLSSFFAARAGL